MGGSLPPFNDQEILQELVGDKSLEHFRNEPGTPGWSGRNGRKQRRVWPFFCFPPKKVAKTGLFFGEILQEVTKNILRTVLRNMFKLISEECDWFTYFLNVRWNKTTSIKKHFEEMVLIKETVIVPENLFRGWKLDGLMSEFLV